MCELGCMIVAFTVLLDGIFAAEACSLNHCNKADRSQSFDSSEMRLSSFYTVLRSAQEETKWLDEQTQIFGFTLNTINCIQAVHAFNLISGKVKHSYEQQNLLKNGVITLIWIY